MASVTPNEANEKPKVTLYWLDRSRAQRILWLLEELGVNYDIKIFKRKPSMLAPSELRKIHPLGKSPLLSVEASDGSEPIVLAESANIVEYLIDHFGNGKLKPKQYPDGKQGQLGGETPEWLRYRHFVHYAEGSLQPLLTMQLVFDQLKGPAVPFFVRPLTKSVANKVDDAFLTPQFKLNFDFVEQQLTSSPGNGAYLAGEELTGADFMMVFPLEVAQSRAGLTEEKWPKIGEYVEMLHQREAYKRATRKAEELSGQKYELV